MSRNADASRKPAYDMSVVVLLDAEVVLVPARAMRTEEAISQARVALFLVLVGRWLLVPRQLHTSGDDMTWGAVLLSFSQSPNFSTFSTFSTLFVPFSFFLWTSQVKFRSVS